MSINDDDKWVEFAERFLSNRREVFDKDVAICLKRTRGTNGYETISTRTTCYLDPER
jgi:hypothetical protein